MILTYFSGEIALVIFQPFVMSLRSFIYLFVFVLFSGTAMPAAWAEGFLSIAKEGNVEIITLAVGKIDSRKVFFLDNPARLVVDVPLASVPAIAMPARYDSGLIRKVRAGRFNDTTIRIVFELKAASTLVTQSLAGGELVLSIAGGNMPKKPPKPLVIIDPGHGGDDPGAIGPRGSMEKDIVFAFAKALQESLLKTGKYRVQLTRESDRFIVLRERVSIARAAKGNIFISIHADSSPNDSARGLSVYTLSEKASDAETEALAASENKVDILGGMDLSHEREDVADILISLAQRETRNQSALLADLLATSLDDHVKLLNNPHRFAGFAVLKAPDIASVLIETGFISHPAEEKLLKTKDYRTRLISGIVKGIEKYFAKQESLTQ